MSYQNYDDVLRQLEAAGLIIKDGLLEVGTTKPVRVRVNGEGREKKGWYRLFEFTIGDGGRLLTGSYGVWSGDDQGAQRIAIAKEARGHVSPEQLAAIKARQLADKQRADAERQR
ncbi:MAG: hypothetical protein KGI52_18470, partial [Burkholderiales bacterium]|nr:hypothetical protein [Burkholderiales bacterium]